MPCAPACKLGTETKNWTCDESPSEQGLPPHTKAVCREKKYSIYIYIASVAFSNGDLEKTGPPWLEHIFAVPTCDRIPCVLQDILAVLGHSFEGSQHGLNIAPQHGPNN